MARPSPGNSQLHLRLPDDLRTLVEGEASLRGFTMNRVVLDRLKSSYDAAEIFSDRRLLEILKLVAHAMVRAGQRHAFLATNSLEEARSWHRTPKAFDAAVQAAGRAFKAMRPR